ncbi:DUF4136 domain-containing protein [Arundinibacter roseus]|uniref:DUF4136 domain-containing protein n=1 Tax=Arundinibacter roseus TaxID=2070510 RepID=A0A4R4JX27_9BACT|nr:DUF4136 domain-containing protein [Arundinibacter roseus]TDB58682.1 DUF4136 domain-containing protein [Arundinibacter roseus]
MKKILKTILLAVAVCTTPLMAQDYRVTSDKDLGAPFDSYKTYSWAKQVRTANSLAYAINDAILKAKIQDAIDHEMAARGYKMKTNNPDLLVNYRIFEEPVEMTGYEGYFRDSEYWGTDEVTNNRLGMLPRSTSTGINDNTTDYYFDAGTLLVQIVDAKKGVVVWQGYASGVLDGDKKFDRDPTHVAKAANMIFDEYDIVLNQ